MRLLALVLGLAVLAGCAEIDEHFTFDAKGAGTYTLQVAWDADLWRRAREALGPTASRALTREAPVPLRAAQVRDGLADLKGVTLTEVSEGIAENGRRTLTVRVGFESLADLWHWEVLARRPVRLGVQPEDGADEGARIAHLEMHPLRRLPVLDTVATLREAVRRGVARAGDPAGPFAAWGLDAERLALVWDMVKVSIQKTVYRVRFDVPGTVRARNGLAPADREPTTTFVFDWAQLQRGPSARRFSLAWSVSELDAVKSMRHRLPEPRGR